MLQWVTASHWFHIRILRKQTILRFLEGYADNFLKELGKKDALQIRVVNKGVNGNLTSSMFFRFRQDVTDLKPDYVIILGGANDIGCGCSVEKIFFNLQRIFETAMDNGIKPVGCTLPSILGWDEGIQPGWNLTGYSLISATEERFVQ